MYQKIHAVHRFFGMRGAGAGFCLEYAAGKLMGFFISAIPGGAGTKVYMLHQWYRPIDCKGCRTVAKDITGIIRSLQCSAVNRCRERLDAAALKARGLVGKDGNGDEKGTVHDTTDYGVTSLLKRRHGL
jgi:hypothetical protein